MIDEWAVRNNTDTHVYQFLSAETFYYELNNLYFDGFFIDIRLPNNENGLDIAANIRKQDSLVPIVFVTSFTEYSFRGYDVGAIKYIVKPACYTDVDYCMNKIAEFSETRINECLTISEKGHLLRLPFRDIYYFAMSSHYIEIHMSSGMHSFYKRFCDLEPELPRFFMKCHRSIIVNTHYIYSFANKSLTLSDKKRTTLPVSSKYAEGVMQEILKKA